MVGPVILFVEPEHGAHVGGVHVPPAGCIVFVQSLEQVGETEWAMDHMILMQLPVLVGQDVASLEVLPQLTASVQHGGVQD